VVAVHAFLQEAQPSDCARKLGDLDAALQRREPNSTKLLHDTAALFSRICGRQPRALEVCRQMLDRALELKPSDSDVMIELGHVSILQRGYHAALRAFREASRYNASDVRALEGTVFSHLLAGETEDAEAQIELLELMQSNPDEASPEFYFYKAMLMYRQSRAVKGDSEDAAAKHIAMLQNCYFMFFKRYDESIKGFLEPLQELVVLDIDFIMQMAQAFTVHMEVPMNAFLPPSNSGGSAGGASSFQALGSSAIAAAQETSKSGETADSDIPPSVETGMGLLRKVLSVAPGCVPAYLELSRIVSALGRPDDALKLLRQCLGMLPTCAAALLLTARIESGRFNTAAADRALEQALSGNFSIRSVILFRYAQAVVRAQQGKTDEALAEIVTLSQLPQFLFSDTGGSSTGIEGGGDELEDSFLDRVPITEEDRVGVIIAHATLLNKSGKVKDGNKLLSDAKVNFAGSAQEIHLLLASSQLAIDRGDFESAIRSLDKIKTESTFFHRAQVLKGEILLVHNHDKEAFTKCYLSLVESNPNEKSYTLLGEAYLRILNPEMAVDAFEEARKRDSTNTKLRARIGKALTATHEYHRAVAFYENILNDAGPDLSTEIIYLSHDLSRLYIKLGRIESATRVLQLVLYPTHKDISEMQMDVKTLELLAYATEQQSAGNAATVGDADERDEEEVLAYLQRAREIQQDVVAQARGSVAASSESVEKERGILSNINEKMGKLYFSTQNYRLADQHLSEALQANPQNAKAMYSMAELYLHKGEEDHCAQQLRKVLTSDPSDELAAVLLSEVVFKDADAAEESIRPLAELLKRHPNSYRTLSKMISILRRVGKLDEVPAYFTRAETHNRRCSGHAGMHFCRGLYARYTNDIIKAVGEFNRCRTDALWGPDSLVHMIELYLNPDQDGVWEEREAGSVIEEEVAGTLHVQCMYSVCTWHAIAYELVGP
jgi:tetratricopeptide repeat protein 21B